MSRHRGQKSARTLAPGTDDVVVGPRASKMRDRRDRGSRGPLSLPGPLSPGRLPIDASQRARFDHVVETAVALLADELQARWPDAEVTVEEAPLLSKDWSAPVPMAVTMEETQDTAQVVLFRRPLTQRATAKDPLQSLVWTALIEQLSELWGIDPEDIAVTPAD